MWVGGNDIENEDKFIWEGSREPVPHAGWLCGQPNNAQRGQDCMIITLGRKGRFDDKQCDETFPYFCENSTVAGK